MRNPATNRSTHCGVQEFTADEGCCNMPYWMMQQLGFKEGSLAIIRQVRHTLEALICVCCGFAQTRGQQNMLPGTFAKIQPHSKDFLDISNPRAVLEKHLRDYSCMTKGDVFQVRSLLFLLWMADSEALRLCSSTITTRCMHSMCWKCDRAMLCR